MVRPLLFRASRIVRDILNFARQNPPRRERFAVAAWVEVTLDLVRQLASRDRVRLATGALPALDVGGDRGQLQQVLVNLLLNALQVSPAEGEVVVTAEAEGGWILLTVADRGPGIPAADQERIFDPFFTTKAVGEGTGPGLSISLGIVERHGGRLTLEPREGGGAEAIVHLPLSGGGS